MRVTVAAIIILHVLNLFAQHGLMSSAPSDAQIRFAKLFTVNSEGKFPTWYSAAMLLACAGLLAVIGLSKRTTRFRWHWCALAVVFAYISVDEAGQIHEEVGTHLQTALQTTGMWTNAWIIPGGVFVIVFGLVMLRFMLQLHRPTRMPFITAGAMYVGGALGMELVSSAYLSLHGFDLSAGTYVLMATLEELLEMSGVAVFLYALLKYMAAQEIGIDTSALPWRRVTVALVCCTGLLFAAGVVGQVSTYVFGHGRLLGFVRLFHLDGEANATTWFNSMLVLAAALACLAMALAERLPRSPRMWWVLAVTFAVFSLDEFASLHELSSESLRELWQTSGLLHYPWVLAGAVVAGLVAALCMADVRRLPRRTAQLVILSGAIFVTGAIGVEVIGAWWSSNHGELNLTYQSITAVEETLELAGLALFTIVVTRRLQRHPIEVRVLAEDAAVGVDASPKSAEPISHAA